MYWVKQYAQHDEPESGSLFKAFRTLCLLLKATTAVGNTVYRQVKENEFFEKWAKI